MANMAILGSGLIERIAEAQGIDAARIRRIVVDARFDDVAIVYVELIGTEKLLGVDWGAAGVEVRVLGEVT